MGKIKAYQWIFVVSDGMNQNQIKNGQRLKDPTLTCTYWESRVPLFYIKSAVLTSTAVGSAVQFVAAHFPNKRTFKE